MTSRPDFFSDRGAASILRLAGLLSLSGLFATSAILIDANMVAPIGDETLAGLGLAASLYGLFMALLFGLGSAAQILLTQSYGAGDEADFRTRLLRLLILGLVLSVCLMVLLRFNINFLVDLLATTSGVGFAAKPYLQLMVYGLPIAYCAYLLSLSFDVKRQSIRELRGFAIEIPLNVILNALLIYGWFGAPELGIEGAAIATLISQSARLLYLLLLIAKDRRGSARPRKKEASPALPRAILLPVTLNVAALIVGAQAYQLLFSQLSYLSFAALALMTPWLSISNVMGRAVATAATLSVADLKRGSDALQATLSAIVTVLRSLAPKLCLAFVGVTLLVGGLSFHISGLVRFEFLTIVPLAGLIVLIRTLSVTVGAVLRAIDNPRWVFWVQVGLQWGFGLPILLALVLIYEPSLHVALLILIVEESVRLGLMAMRLRSLL